MTIASFMGWPRVAIAALTLLLGALLPLSRAAVPEFTMETEVAKIVAAQLAPEATADDPGGLAIAVSVAGHTQLFNYGSADAMAKRPVTSDSLFNLASLRKVFEATLVALGTLRGEISLDDRVSSYVPELRSDYMRQITLGQLVSHTSGLLLPTDHPPWPNATYTLAEFFDMLNAWTPEAGEAPGKQRIYTHAGYVLLQVALERRYRLPIRQLIEDRILTPLGMKSTLVPDRAPDNRAVVSPTLMPRLVQGYSDRGMAIGPPGDQQSYFDFPGTGQMFSSARDLAIFMSACLDGTGADAQLAQALQMTQHEMFRSSEKFGQAMAWETVHLDEGIVVDKPGGLNNASSYMGLVPARRIGILLLANRGEFPHEIARYKVLPALSRL
jgi:beta-lactamase class C